MGRHVAVGDWWISDKRGVGQPHKVATVMPPEHGYPPRSEDDLMPRYDFTKWDSACGQVLGSAVLFSVPAGEHRADRCEACA